MDRDFLMFLVLVLVALVIIRWWSIWTLTASVLIGWFLIHCLFWAFPLGEASGLTWDEDAEEWLSIGWPLMLLWCLTVYFLRRGTVRIKSKLDGTRQPSV